MIEICIDMIKNDLCRAPDHAKAVTAAENILELLNRKPTIDNASTDGEQIVSPHHSFFSSTLSNISFLVSFQWTT